MLGLTTGNNSNGGGGGSAQIAVSASSTSSIYTLAGVSAFQLDTNGSGCSFSLISSQDIDIQVGASESLSNLTAASVSLTATGKRITLTLVNFINGILIVTCDVCVFNSFINTTNDGAWAMQFSFCHMTAGDLDNLLISIASSLTGMSLSAGQLTECSIDISGPFNETPTGASSTALADITTLGILVYTNS